MLLRDRYAFEAEPVGVKPVYTADVWGLIAWLETQPGETTYDFMDIGDCLFCRFAATTPFGQVRHDGTAHSYSDFCAKAGFLSHQGDADLIACSQPNTYTAALERARAYAASLPTPSLSGETV